jgi:hypothetical protein
MKPNWNDILLIGVDGGATETKVHEVQVSGSGAKLKFCLGRHSASRKYRQLPDFKPVNVPQQIKERDEGTSRLTPEEERQGRSTLSPLRRRCRKS